MLSRLTVKDFILIDDLQIDFSSGFNVLTGETGAGKSMIIDALMLIMGARTNKGLIRKGCELSFLQACFDLDSSNLAGRYGLDESGSGTIVVSREIKVSGKSFSKINGELVTLKEVQNIADELLSVYGQEDRSKLFESNEQLKILDSYIGDSLSLFLKKIKSIVEKYHVLNNELESLKIKDDRAVEREIENIEFQISDIDKAELSDDDENIEERYQISKNSSDVILELDAISKAIDSDDEFSLMSAISFIIGRISNIESFDSSFSTHTEMLNEMKFKLNDLYREVENMANRLSSESQNLIKLEERLDTVNNLKKKYGNTIDEILKYRDTLNQKLLDLQNVSQKRNKIESEIENLKREYFEIASKISESRKKGAKKLSESVTKSLKELNFKNGEFEVLFSKTDEISSGGFDKVDFLVRFNAGSDFSPLRKTASGGELSRVMLALQEVIGAVYRTPTMIFDEIDTGISGVAANSVAKKMYKVSKKHQIISVSHMLQVALYADHHFLIEKKDELQQTRVFVKELDREKRVDEICRLISLDDNIPEMRTDAEKMLNNVENTKAGL